RCRADDAVTKRFDLLAVANNGFGPNALERSAVFFGHDHVLSNVDQASGQITRVRRLQGRVGQTLSSAVCRDKILQDVQPFAEVSKDRVLDDLTRRLGHEAAHSGELADLSVRAASA